MALLNTMISLALLSISASNAAPLQILQKRIAQSIPEATAKWEQACLAAGGGQACNPQSVAAFSTLLAAPGACEQQNQADNMIDLAKQLGNDAEMIRLTQLFVQQPRNTPNSQSVLYCQQAPRNQELAGLFQCQFQGVNDNIFTGGVPAGSPGTIPFGLSSLSPPGSCPANPNGKVPDGQQLNALVNDPGAGNTGGNNGGNNGNGNNEQAPQQPAPAPVTTTAAPAPVVTPPANNGNTPAPSTGFALSNAQAAQALNREFQTLTEGGACDVGRAACIGDNFAQCPFGSFVTSPCAGGLVCRALPLVNSVGTSVTCTTLEDAARRFEAAGATGGFDGQQSNAVVNDPQPAPAPVTTAPAPVVTPPANNGNTTPAPSTGFALSNAQAAQALNREFQTLTEGGACDVGRVACIGDNFAQCPFGSFVTSPCAGGLVCRALPLVNSVGTSVTCTTLEDAARRFEAAGATGGFDGQQ